MFLTLPDQLLHTIQRHRLIPPGEPIVVAVSGGADSLALLHILHSHRDNLRIQLHVATLDHGLRGEDGAADAAYVEGLARAWGLPVTVGRAALDPAAPGVEARARAARYRFLASVAQQTGARRVAVAHHAGDQAETVLMHIIRGSGLRGLSGMAYECAYPDADAGDSLRLIRPLLDVPRSAIDAYCAAHGLSPRSDPTNADTAYLRNRLRLEILPLLRQINPQVEAALGRLAAISREDDTYMQAALSAQMDAHTSREGERVSLDRDAFAALHPALQRRAVARAALALNPDAEPGYEHLTHAVQIALEGAQGALAMLPGGLQLRVDYTALHIEPAGSAAVDLHRPPEGYPLLLPADTEIVVQVPGHTSTPLGWSLWVAPPSPGQDCRARLSVPPGSRVTLRTRRPGDVFSPPGLGGRHQKLKKWLIDHKVPQGLRDHLPILVIDEKIAALLIGVRWKIAFEFIHDVNSLCFVEITSL